VNDLLLDATGSKNAVLAFARNQRHHMVREVLFHLQMPTNSRESSNSMDNSVPVDVMLEVEEERAEALAPLSRLDSIRPSSRLQERVRARRAANKFTREEQVGRL
jgi:hypothetical protein